MMFYRIVVGERSAVPKSIGNPLSMLEQSSRKSNSRFLNNAADSRLPVFMIRNNLRTPGMDPQEYLKILEQI